MSTKNIGRISDLVSKSESAPKGEDSHIEVLEERITTLETALKIVLSELTAIRADMEVIVQSPKKKRKPYNPFEDPEMLKAIEAVRPQILEMLSGGEETTKQDCATALGIEPSLAGRTLSYMVTQTKEIKMTSPPTAEGEPEPKKVFSLK